MNKKERIRAAIAGAPVDTVPYGLWTHVPGIDRDPVLNAEKTVEFYRQYDLDFIKTMNNGMYSIEDFGATVDDSEVAAGGVARIKSTPVHSPEDWERIREVPVSRGALMREQEYLGRVLDKVQGENVPVIFTVFSPLTTANKLCGGKVLEYIAAGAGDRVRGALEAITDTTCRLAERVTEMGADGIFFASQMSSYEVTDEETYREYGMPYDVRVLGASGGWFNVLHCHGSEIMFSLLREYPVQVFNWHAWETLPTVEEAALYTGRCLMGGICRMDITNRRRNQVRHQIYETLRATKGRKLILSPGCVIRHPLDGPMLSYVKQVKTETEPFFLHGAREGGKGE